MLRTHKLPCIATRGAHTTVTLCCDPVLVCVDWRGTHTNSMRILRHFLKKGAHMLQCLCGQRSEPTTTTSGETFSCACSHLSDEKRSHWPLALVSTSSVSAVLCAPTPRLCANLFVRAHATSCDHSCHSISHLMTRIASPSWSWAEPLLLGAVSAV